MNSKDLNSINEAFVQATAKVVAEGSKDDPLGTGKTKELGTTTKDVDRDKKDKKKDKKVKEDINPHAYDDIADNEIQVGSQVEIAVDAAKGAGEVGEVVAISDSGASLKVATSSGEVVVDRKDVWPTGSDDDASGAIDDADWMGDNVNNIMDEYEGRLSRNFGVKKVREKAESGETFKQPDEKISEVDSKTQRPKGEVKADEKSKDVGDVKKDLQEPVEGNEKDDKKDEKVVKESINNSNKGNIMSEDKSIFDKLYEQVMGEDDEFGAELGLPGGDDLEVGDELGDEGGEEVTVTLSPDQVSALKAVVDQFPSDDEEGGDEFGDEDPAPAVPDESFEGVQEDHTPTTGQATSDGTKPGTDPSDGGGKATDPAADSLGGKSSGTGDAKVTDDAATTGKDTGEGKKTGVAKGAGKPGSQKAAAKI